MVKLLTQNKYLIMQNSLNIKNWAKDDRPREKLMLKGINSLSNAELIAILIGSGNKKETAVELAKNILLDMDNDLNELGKQNISDLMKFNGIGEAKAISIIAALELGKRRNISEIINKKKISSVKDSFNYFSPLLRDIPHEEFWILLLNHSQKIISSHKISQGGIAVASVDIRIIMKLAIEKSASKIILSHNHPSGNKKPSKADILLTENIYKAGKIMNFEILDHIIIAEDKYYSFADQGVVFDKEYVL